jgi:hypothetical protein
LEKPDGVASIPAALLVSDIVDLKRDFGLFNLITDVPELQISCYDISNKLRLPKVQVL